MKIYQVDAFTDKLFGGNPAAIIFLETWLDDATMQAIGNENNLAETAFIVPEGKDYRIRWFTPEVEVDLCGHATLAAAFVLFNELSYPRDIVHFQSNSGLLTVTKNTTWLTLDFPADKLIPISISDQIRKTTDAAIVEAYQGRSDYVLVLESQKDIEGGYFDLDAIRSLGHRGVIVTARGEDVDFVSRFFAPAYGINEDPVTGSAHTSLTPYWANVLGKTQMEARQLSKRGGYLKCSLQGDRVLISGQGVLYMKGDIFIR